MSKRFFSHRRIQDKDFILVLDVRKAPKVSHVVQPLERLRRSRLNGFWTLASDNQQFGSKRMRIFADLLKRDRTPPLPSS